MDIKYGILFVTLFVGGFAVPTPEQDMSIFFQHVDPTARIIGGTQAAAGSHPHMVAMSTGTLVRSFMCGGSLVSTRTVLTAAHCVEAVFRLFGSISSSLRLTVGTNRWNQGGVMYAVSRNVSHPHYLAETIKNDIAILITSTNVAQSALVRPITLSYDFVNGGVNSRVAGWGLTATNGATSATLLEINQATLDGQQCVRDVIAAAVSLNTRAPPVEPHIELCTFHSAGRGICSGDSGSALARIDNGRQIGIVSWGIPCALGAPDIFVRISFYQSWLQQNIV